jgi:phosphonopyruvate decarboxylase
MMIAADEFIAELRRHGIGLVSGVPCSYLAGPIALLAAGSDPRYVAAANEGAALATAAGAWLAGVPAAVLAQNSGFGNLVNPLTSLVLPYRIAVLVVMSVRGREQDGDAEPQHASMARLLAPWLDSLGIPYRQLTPDTEARSAIDDAMRAVAAGTTAFLLVTKGAIGGALAGPAEPRPGLTRAALVDAVLAEAPDHPVLATTGYMSRALFNAGDRPQNFYLQGSMGHVVSLALGAALCRPDQRFVVLDGDGALLMHLGVLASVGTYLPPNLVHVVFDNGTYASTGAQATPGAGTDYARLALACGYSTAERVAEEAGLRDRLRAALRRDGPSFLAVDGSAVEAVGARASTAIGLDKVAARFRAGLAEGGSAEPVRTGSRRGD